MSLATRLSAFFLIALALVLAGFSGSSVSAGPHLSRHASSTNGCNRPWTRWRRRSTSSRGASNGSRPTAR